MYASVHEFILSAAKHKMHNIRYDIWCSIYDAIYNTASATRQSISDRLGRISRRRNREREAGKKNKLYSHKKKRKDKKTKKYKKIRKYKKTKKYN